MAVDATHRASSKAAPQAGGNAICPPSSPGSISLILSLLLLIPTFVALELPPLRARHEVVHWGRLDGHRDEGRLGRGRRAPEE